MARALLTISILAGTVPAVLMLAGYLIHVKWHATSMGRLIVALMSITVVSYVTSSVVVLHPGWFTPGAGDWIRIGIRLAIAAALWAVLAVFVRAQFFRE
jgi:hypothetical protein